MTSIPPLSQWKTINDFNKYSKKLKVHPSSKGRLFKLERSTYTMNEVVFQFNKCVKNTDNSKKVNKGLERIDKINAKANRRKTSSVRKYLGNAWFSLWHKGFDKTKTLNAIRAQHFEPVQISVSEVIDPLYTKVLNTTPEFKFYKLPIPECDVAGNKVPTPNSKTVLTGLSLRPSNLFFEAIGVEVTLPGQGLFKVVDPQAVVQLIAAKDKEEIFSFSAKGKEVTIHDKSWKGTEKYRLEDILGDKEFQMTFGEVAQILQSQQIYTSSHLPLPFYLGLKKAIDEDNIIELDRKVKFADNPAVQKFFEEARKDPLRVGFKDLDALNDFLEFHIYEIGSMVVKIEDFYIFLDKNGKLIERKAGEKDNLRLINACGLRNLFHTKTRSGFLEGIIYETFETALIAAGEGLICFPAVGMGVWGGNPDLYWPAFLEAVASAGDSIEHIFINPNHAKTPSKWHANLKSLGFDISKLMGEEFQIYLTRFKEKYKNDEKALKNLNKITNLSSQKTDLIQLARNLKLAFPDKVVSIFNASDPDVTLGNHVGEYTNNLPHGASTTEENYTAMGTNGLCFESITKVREDPTRVHQVIFENRKYKLVSHEALMA